ncbi:MAG: lipopolysaccharide assembly protein LapA domain-containing protein [Kiritimatiellia bacterium]
MKKAKLIGMLAALLLGVVVILQNAQPVNTRFLFVTVTMPNAVLLGLTLLIGITIGSLWTLTVVGRRR